MLAAAARGKPGRRAPWIGACRAAVPAAGCCRESREKDDMGEKKLLVAARKILGAMNREEASYVCVGEEEEGCGG